MGRKVTTRELHAGTQCSMQSAGVQTLAYQGLHYMRREQVLCIVKLGDSMLTLAWAARHAWLMHGLGSVVHASSHCAAHQCV